MLTRLFVVGCLSVATLGCAGFRRGPVYSGAREDRLVSPLQIALAETVPAGYDRLGRVSARCTPLRELDELSDEPLSNLDCTRERLLRALKETAAEVGGELLVRVRCREPRGDLSCHGVVARPEDETLASRKLVAATPPAKPPAPTPPEVARLDEPHVARSWSIYVSFERAADVGSRAPRLPSAVTRSGVLSPHHLAIGDAAAHCERGDCDARELEHALRLAAARAGADSLAGVRCFEGDGSATCVGTLGVLPIEADRHLDRGQ